MNKNEALQQFIEWLKENDPFIYAAMMRKLKTQGVQLGWVDTFAAVASSIASVGSAYTGYKTSKDNIKLQKAQLKYQYAADQKVEPEPQLNEQALADIMKRLEIASAGKPQPQTPHTPAVDVQKLSNPQEAVRATTGGQILDTIRKPVVYVPALLVLSFLLYKQRF